MDLVIPVEEKIFLKKLLHFSSSCANILGQKKYALLAQLDRASGYGPEGRGFESLTACSKPLFPIRKGGFIFC